MRTYLVVGLFLSEIVFVLDVNKNYIIIRMIKKLNTNLFSVS